MVVVQVATSDQYSTTLARAGFNEISDDSGRVSLCRHGIIWQSGFSPLYRKKKTNLLPFVLRASSSCDNSHWHDGLKERKGIVGGPTFAELNLMHRANLAYRSSLNLGYIEAWRHSSAGLKATIMDLAQTALFCDIPNERIMLEVDCDQVFENRHALAFANDLGVQVAIRIHALSNHPCNCFGRCFTPTMVTLDSESVLQTVEKTDGETRLKTLLHPYLEAGVDVAMENISSFRHFDVGHQLGANYFHGSYLSKVHNVESNNRWRPIAISSLV